MHKLIPRSHFERRPTTVDSVRAARRLSGGQHVEMSLLTRFRDAYDDQADARATRLRNQRYVFGTDQWGDYVEDEHGRKVRERERIARRTGGVVLQTNRLIKVCQSIMGVGTAQAVLPICQALQPEADQKSEMMTAALQTNWENNQMATLMATELLELLTGGVSVMKTLWGVHDGREDVYNYHVDLGHFVWVAEGSDPRLWDMSMVGEIVDYTLGELASVLAGSEYDYRQLEEIYRPYINRYSDTGTRMGEYDDDSFDTPPQSDLCRTYHIWTKEHKPRYRCADAMDFENPLYRIETDQLDLVLEENVRRVEQAFRQQMIDAAERDRLTRLIQRRTPSERMPYTEVPLVEWRYIVDEYWYFRMLSPDGRVLEEYESPYEHRSHPYSIKMFVYVNGMVIPYFSTVIDQQRYVNRLITLNDLAINNSIKGLKMIPRSVLGGMSEQEFAEQAVEIGGWIFYDDTKLRGNLRPEVITSNSIPVGLPDLLQLEMQSLDEATVNEAFQGRAPANGSTPASRYRMESSNAANSLNYLFSEFSMFQQQVATKEMKTIQQYYTEPRNVSVRHSNGLVSMGQYDPKTVDDTDFEVRVRIAPDTAQARGMMNEQLETWAANGWLGLEDLLEFGYYPMLQGLRQKIASTKEVMRQQGMDVPQDGAGAGQRQVPGANADTVRRLQGILRQGQDAAA